MSMLLASTAWSADWSPDGNQIVFHSLFDDIHFERGAIYLMNRDGTEIQKITDDNVYNFNPFFSPDGKQIAFNVGDQDATLNIYRMDVDGSNRTRVTE